MWHDVGVRVRCYGLRFAVHRRTCQLTAVRPTGKGFSCGHSLHSDLRASRQEKFAVNLSFLHEPVSFGSLRHR